MKNKFYIIFIRIYFFFLSSAFLAPPGAAAADLGTVLCAFIKSLFCLVVISGTKTPFFLKASTFFA